MSGETSNRKTNHYDTVGQSYELDIKNGPGVTVKEVDEGNANDGGRPRSGEQYDTQSKLLPQMQSPAHGTLVQDPRWELMLDIYDSILVVIAVVLLLKTSLCIFAWHKDRQFSGKYLDAVSPLTLQLIRFNEQVITAFTIIFVTIMTTVTRRYALYKAQQGAYITDLEQLQASISLPSTIKMVFSLRKFTKFSITLVFLWSFYYLGSQASKREYTLAVSDRFRPMAAAYPKFNMTQYIDQFSYSGDQVDRDFLSSIGGLTDTKVANYGVDDNGNILLPDPYLLDLLFANGTVNNTNPVKIRPSGTTYGVLSGRPLYVSHTEQYIDSDNHNQVVDSQYWSDSRIVGDYSLQTSYIKLDCRSFDIFPVDRFPAGVPEVKVASLNMTQSNSTQATGSTSPQQLEYWQRWNGSYPFTSYADNGSYADTNLKINGSDGGAIRVTCDIFEPRVNVDVRCSESSCLVVKMSCPQTDPTSLRTTMFSNTTFGQAFFNDMLSAEGVPKSRDSWGLVTGYLSVPDSYILDAATVKLYTSDMLNAQTSWFETVINTYINIAERSFMIPGYDDPAPAGFELVKISGALWDPHYAVFWEWIVIDYLAGLLLLVAAAASFWLRKHTLVPDIFGFVSSLTRDNPHFPVLPGSSALDGISRTRALRNVKVKVGDIGGPHGEVGRLGFVPIVDTIPTEGLSKHRKYM